MTSKPIPAMSLQELDEYISARETLRPGPFASSDVETSVKAYDDFPPPAREDSAHIVKCYQCSKPFETSVYHRTPSPPRCPVCCDWARRHVIK